ncbi:MAG: methionyl-tRNA formyltransferase [Phycisphaera sp.]|nr:methionyl-tRNA formyltransferase [Phycisphaera sp.]
MRLILLGSGEFGLPTFEALRTAHDIAAVITQPDKPAGRKRVLTPTPVGQWADANHLLLIKTDNVNETDFIDRTRALKADAAVVIAFGQKLSDPFIRVLGGLAVNLHASLLPRHRGASPINHAILTGDRQAGVTVIGLAQRMDAGLMFGKASIPIDPLETAGELHDRLAQLGPAVVAGVLDRYSNGKLVGQTQDETQATKAPKLSKADGTVDFDHDADVVRSRIQALNPWPGIRVTWRNSHGNERELHLLRAEAVPDLSCFISLHPGSKPTPGCVLDDKGHVAVRDGSIRLLEVQLPGGKPMKIADFIRGHHFGAGDILAKIDP